MLPDRELTITIRDLEPLHLEKFEVFVSHRPTGVSHSLCAQGISKKYDVVSLALYQLEQKVARHKHRKGII